MTKEELGNDQSVNLARGEIKCAKCQSSNLRGDNYCRRCGARLSIKCRRCGQMNERSLVHCSKCGSRLRRSSWRHWRRKVFGKRRDNKRVDELVPVFLAIVGGLLIAWVVCKSRLFR